MPESYAGKINRKLLKKQRIIAAAAGREPADLVLKNATFVNVFSNELSTMDIAVAEGLIVGMGSYQGRSEVDCTGKIVLPGFLDAHIHLESSLVSPTEFVKAVLPHGTTTVVTDPHEIANVMGTDGIEYMLQATEDLPVDVRFMLPSCVPATPLDESGAILDYRAIDSFYDHPRVQGLAEMMNFVGAINGDEQTVEKIVAAQAHHKKIDGHAPDLQGNDLNAYIAAGVYSDHECHDVKDAIAKLERGQFIMIREGTAARNLEALMPLLTGKYADRCMFCTDDKHPNDLLEKGHIDYIVKKAISLGADPITAVKVACHNAARYFLLNNRGGISPGYLADFVIIDNFQDFNIEQVYKKGVLMVDHGEIQDFPSPEIEPYLVERAHKTFHVAALTAEDFAEKRPRGIIGMVDGEITTVDAGYSDRIDVEYDVLKIAVVERHKNTHHIGIGYIQGYGLKSGAVATSISHDSHNIIVVGATDEDMAAAANRIVENRGGITVMENGQVLGEVTLSIAGIMSDDSLVMVNSALEDAVEDAALDLLHQQDGGDGHAQQCEDGAHAHRGEGLALEVLVGDEGGIAVDDELCVLQADKGNEQADAHADCALEGHGDGVEDALTDVGQAQHNEDDALNKDGHQGQLPAVAHREDDGIGKVGVQAHAGSQREGVVGQQSHQGSADEGCQCGGDQHSLRVHAGSRQDVGVDRKDVGHSHEGGNTCHDLGLCIGVVFLQMKDIF